MSGASRDDLEMMRLADVAHYEEEAARLNEAMAEIPGLLAATMAERQRFSRISADLATVYGRIHRSRSLRAWLNWKAGR